MDKEKVKSKFAPQGEDVEIDRPTMLNNLRHQVNIQGEKITDAQQKIEQMKTILTDARRRLEILKKRNVDKSQ